MRNREKILNIIEQRKRDEALKDLTPEQIEIVRKNMNVPTSQETPAPAASHSRDDTIPDGQHPFETLVQQYMRTFSIGKLEALKRATREHPDKHRSFIQFHNPGKRIG